MNYYFTEEEQKELLKLNQIDKTKTIIKKVFANKTDKAGRVYRRIVRNNYRRFKKIKL